MKPGDYLPKCFPNRVTLSAHFRQECNAKEVKPLLKLAQNTQNPARLLAETWQGSSLERHTAKRTAQNHVARQY